MTTYRVFADGRELARYTDFDRAGHYGVRGVDLDGNSEEYSGTNAHQLALQTAEQIARREFGRPTPARVQVLREDGTVAVEIKSL